MVLKVFGLHIVYPPVYGTALNEQEITVEVEVLPLKRRDLAYAKAEALGDKNHRAERLFELRHDGLELVRSQNRWTLPALRAAFMRTSAIGFLCSLKSSQRAAH